MNESHIADVHLYTIMLTLIQLSSCYLRYLPFSPEISTHERNLLIRSFLIWSLAGFLLNIYIFSDGINYRAFKLAFYIGWLPYFLLSMMIIRNKTAQHIFVLGIQLLWSFMLHAFAGMVVAIIYGTMAEKFLPLQIGFYLLLFFVLLKLERKFFIKLLPTPTLFDNEQLKWAISLLPFAIFIGTSISIVDVTFLPTWQERLSRISLPLFFLIIYRSISVTTRQITEKISAEELNRHLFNKMEALKVQNELIKRNQQEVASLHENLKDYYCVIDKLLATGRISEAKSFISQQSELLEATSIVIYCREPLINAAILINLRRATKFGIKTTHNVDLSEKILTNEDDLAVLVNDLLANAITESLQQKNPLKREISLILRHKGGQNILEVERRNDLPINFGENGLPYANELRHGMGMNSAELFAEKYDAFVNVSQENEFVRLTIYWNDYLRAK